MWSSSCSHPICEHSGVLLSSLAFILLCQKDASLYWSNRGRVTTRGPMNQAPHLQALSSVAISCYANICSSTYWSVTSLWKLTSNFKRETRKHFTLLTINEDQAYYILPHESASALSIAEVLIWLWGVTLLAIPDQRTYIHSSHADRISSTFVFGTNKHRLHKHSSEQIRPNNARQNVLIKGCFCITSTLLSIFTHTMHLRSAHTCLVRNTDWSKDSTQGKGLTVDNNDECFQHQKNW